ncbi:MAG TPA: YceI family protein [Ilumatobacter sp.]|jgi:polyisoprenoid-binding protein YceI|nr:YceI family protein [Ilumatobacter sp.]
MSDTQQYTDLPIEPTPGKGGRRIPRWVIFTVLGLILLVVLFYGAILLYAKVINDSPDEFTSGDIDAALSAAAADGTTPAATAITPQETVATAQPPVATAAPNASSPNATSPNATATASSAPAATIAAPPAAASSQWVATDASQVGYRVQEILFGVDTTAVGRTNQVEGTLTIDGTQVTGVEFTVDVASITSDESRRDSAFRGRVMSADEFPTASFELTEPIDVGVAPTDGTELTTQATGDLTLRGVTNPVTFEVTAKQDAGLIGVQGGIPVVFNDYGIANPSNGGVQTEDDGLVEFILVFEPAT